ncbi:MAG: RNA polymerase factor sigma-32 [Alphaproteobacteria bacterium]
MTFVNSSQTERSDRRYIANAMEAPYLDREEEQALARRWRDEKDEGALHELIESHARLVVRIAWDFRRSGMPLGDLVQEGNIGLAQAAARFDPDRDVRFATYAGWWIMAEIQDFILRNASIVRFATTPVHRSLFFKLRRIRAQRPTLPDGSLPSAEREALAKELGVSLADIERIDSSLARGDQSLSATRESDDSEPLQDMLADPGPSPEEIAIESVDGDLRRERLREALGHLTPRERTIIANRFLGERRQTLSEIGDSFGVSKERIRQLEAKALAKLEQALRDPGAANGDRFIS